MSAWQLALRHLLARPLAALLSTAMLTLGLLGVGLVLFMNQSLNRAFERDLAGVDLVVGAKGSPLQLILSGLMHADIPAGNVPLADVQALAQHPLVADVIPLALGDNHAGFRIVGSDLRYPALYGARLASGQLFASGEAGQMQAVLGAQVAKTMGWTLGQRFVGSHGLQAGGHAHGDLPYTVVGVLAPCACVLDRLILTSVESVWKVHESDVALDAEDARLLAQDRELTVALVRYKSPLAAVSVPRWVQAQSSLQAAAPALEVARLMTLIGSLLDGGRGLALLLLVLSALSVTVALLSVVREQQADWMLLRMLGARPWRLAAVMVWHAGITMLLGLLCAALVAYLLYSLPGGAAHLGLLGTLALGRETLAFLWPVPGLALGVVVLSSILPLWHIYRIDISQAFHRSI